MSALLRVAWPQLDVAPPDQRWLSGGVRRRAAHQRPADSSGAWGSHGRSQPPPPGAVRCFRARASPCSPHTRGRQAQRQRAGACLLPSALRCRLDSQPFRLPSGSPAWDPREGSLKHRLGHPRAFDFEVWWGLGMCISAGSRVVPQIWDPR